METTRKPVYLEGPKIIEIPLDEIISDDLKPYAGDDEEEPDEQIAALKKEYVPMW